MQRALLLVIAILGISGSGAAQIWNDEAIARLKPRQAAREAEQSQPTAVKPLPATRPAPASQPAAVEPQASVDGVPFGEVTYASANDHPPKVHARLSDVAQLLLCPPGKTGIKLFSVSASGDIFKRRLPRGLRPDASCQFFAADVGGAEVALFKTDLGIISRIVLCYRDAQTSGRMVAASYGSKRQGSPWHGEPILIGSREPYSLYVSAEREIQEWQKKDAEAKADREPDPIKRAIRKHQLALGMTLDEANTAMLSLPLAVGTVPGELFQETKDYKVFRWRSGFYEDSVVHYLYTYGRFVDGKLEAIWKDRVQ